MSIQPFLSFPLLLSILDQTNDGINIVDASGNLVYINSHSASYVNRSKDEMIGKHIANFYPKAVLLKVLETKEPVLDQKIHFIGGKKYVVSSYPIFDENNFMGAYSIFKDVQEIDALNRKIKYLEMQVSLNSPITNLSSIIGKDNSLKEVIHRAKRTVGAIGGPRHAIITGESGTGKTMLAHIIHDYAKEVGVISKDAPFIEINCAQFTNPDVAAIEIFGSEKGAFTGSTHKKGLFEQANGGILFLDEAHALDNYQNLLLKALESGRIRRIGGVREIDVNVIIIAASTKNLASVFLPELYQRLAQYEIYMPSLNERSQLEKKHLFSHFVNKYEEAVKSSHGIDYKVDFTDSARDLLLHAAYPRNIRQFRDIINFSIDAASPLIAEVNMKTGIVTTVEVNHIPLFDDTKVKDHLSDNSFKSSNNDISTKGAIEKEINHQAKDLIERYFQQGYGARKISNILSEHGYDIKYYRIAYYLKKITS